MFLLVTSDIKHIIYRLAGTAVRFEPGEGKTVSLIALGGRGRTQGGNNIVNKIMNPHNHNIHQLPPPLPPSASHTDLPPIQSSNTGAEVGTVIYAQEQKDSILEELSTQGFCNSTTLTNVESIADGGFEVSRAQYAVMYGPTTGDIIRLADTDLYVRVENDLTTSNKHYGDECKFGGGKVLREGMGQATGIPCADQLDTLICNVIIIDYSGIYKADIGIKNGIIVGVGKAGNPDIMDHVNMIVGVNTDVSSS